VKTFGSAVSDRKPRVPLLMETALRVNPKGGSEKVKEMVAVSPALRAD
jgi:hypothetical protein